LLKAKPDLRQAGVAPMALNTLAAKAAKRVQSLVMAVAD
jgi:hypothetical protein